MKVRLPVDATLRTIAASLNDPKEYVRSVFANMRGGCGEMIVRLALDSNPAAPDYCIEMYFEERTITGEWEVVGSQFLAAFVGRNHKEVPLTEDEPARPWSNAAMSWENVQTLLGELRGISMPPKPLS